MVVNGVKLVTLKRKCTLLSGLVSHAFRESYKIIPTEWSPSQIHSMWVARSCVCSFKESLLGILLIGTFAIQGYPDAGDVETCVDVENRIFPIPA